MTFAPPISLALRGVLGDDAAAWVEARAATPYNARPVSDRFAGARPLLHALDAGDTEALGCVVAMAAKGPAEPCTPLTAAVLADPSLHGDELLVLECLRHHAAVASPEALPFLVRRCAVAQTGLDRSPCPARAELLAAYLDEAVGRAGIVVRCPHPSPVAALAETPRCVSRWLKCAKTTNASPRMAGAACGFHVFSRVLRVGADLVKGRACNTRPAARTSPPWHTSPALCCCSSR